MENMNLETMQHMLGQTISITKTNAESSAVMIRELEYIKTLVGGFSTKINNISDNIINLEDRMSEIELNEEITEEMANNIRDTVNKRVIEILHFDENEIAKYFRTFVIQCYSSLKKLGMGSSYRRTKKRYYQMLLDKAEAWIPDEGIQSLKDKIDKRAKAKREALLNGYIV